VAGSYLATIPSPTQGVWHIAGLPLRAYAMCIILGIVAAVAVTEYRLRQRGAPRWLTLDVAIYAVPAGIVGARLYHVITTPSPYFGAGGNPVAAFYIWNGGLGIWGGVAGGALGAWYATRKAGIPLTTFADALAPGMPLAQAIGRWGNYFNNELYGGHTSLPWGLVVNQWNSSAGQALRGPDGAPLIMPGGPFHPTFLYESVWDVGVAVLVYLVDRKFKLGRGRAFALYVAAYTAGRFWVESLRIDTAVHILGLRLNDWTSLIVFAAAVVYFIRVKGPQEHLRIEADGKLTAVTEDGEPVQWRKPPVPATGSVGESGEPAPGEPSPGRWAEQLVRRWARQLRATHDDDDDDADSDGDDPDELDDGGGSDLGSQGTSRGLRR
jgi:prolipoprotein diacylglyceryl transferase